MKRPYKLILASMLCAAPFGVLLPGCGGGGSSHHTSLDVEDTLGVILFGSKGESTNPVTQANLKVSWEDSASSKKSGIAELQITNGAAPVPTATPTGTVDPAATATPTPDPANIAIFPPPATYICKGDITITPGHRTLNFNGSYASPNAVSFTLTGDFVIGGKVTLTAHFKAGTSVLVGTFTDPISTKTPTPAATGTPVGTATP